jgi:hypothetical protein
MRLAYLIMGFILLPFGIILIYVDKYLAVKQAELRRRGFRDVNLYWPFYGPRPVMGVLFVFAGLFFLAICFLK